MILEAREFNNGVWLFFPLFLLYTPYLLPDGVSETMSETMSEYIVCQGEDHVKKVISG